MNQNEKLVKGSRTYKDTVFRMLFREKRELLSLYNAMNGSSYSNPEDLQIVTLENAVYMNVITEQSIFRRNRNCGCRNPMKRTRMIRSWN